MILTANISGVEYEMASDYLDHIKRGAYRELLPGKS